MSTPSVNEYKSLPRANSTTGCVFQPEAEKILPAAPHVIPYSFFNYGYTPKPIDPSNADRLVVQITKHTSGELLVLTVPKSWSGKVLRFIFGNKKDVDEALLQTDLKTKYGEKITEKIFTDTDLLKKREKGLSALDIKHFYDLAAMLSFKDETDNESVPDTAKTFFDTPHSRSRSSSEASVASTVSSITSQESVASTMEDENQNADSDDESDFSGSILNAHPPLTASHTNGSTSNKNVTALSEAPSPLLISEPADDNASINTNYTFLKSVASVPEEPKKEANVSHVEKKIGKASDFLAIKKEQNLAEEVVATRTNLKFVPTRKHSPEQAQKIAGLQGSFTEYFQKLKKLKQTIDQLQQEISKSAEKQKNDLANPEFSGKPVHVENANALESLQNRKEKLLLEQSSLQTEQEKVVAELKAEGVRFDELGQIIAE